MMNHCDCRCPVWAPVVEDDPDPTGGGWGGRLKSFLVQCCFALAFSIVVRFIRNEVEVAERLKKTTTNFDVPQFIAYRVDYYFSNSIFAKPLTLLFITIFLVPCGGLLYSYVSHKPFWSSALWSSWTFVADPGSHADEEHFGERVVALLLTMCGMVVFALLIGLINDLLEKQVDSLRKGRSRVIEARHTLVIGWGDKLLPVLSQIALANESEGGGMVVLMAEQDKEEMEDYLAEHSLDMKNTKVICRSGTINEFDLLKVSARAARSIIILADQTVSPDSSDSKALRAVLCLKGMDAPSDGHIVVELCDVDNSELVQLIGDNKVEMVVAHDILGRLMIHCARQPGLSMVLEKILGYEDNEFYLQQWPELVGCTFEEIHYRFEDAIPIGIKRGGSPPSDIILNPRSDLVLKEGDMVLVIAEDNDSYAPSRREALPPERKMDLRRPVPERKEPLPERLLFVNWRRDIADMIAQLDQYVPPGSELTIYSTLTRESMTQKLAEGLHDKALKLSNITVKCVRGNAAIRRQLETLPIERYDSILILCDEQLEDSHSVEMMDSRSIISLLLIRDIRDKRREKILRAGGPEALSALTCIRTPSLISEILDSNTRDLISIANVSDYVLSNELVSMALAMVSEQREINAVLQEMFSAHGNEIYLREANLYVEENSRTSFWHVMRSARLLNELALGYKLPHSSTPVINPPKKDLVHWVPGSLLIIISKE